MSLCAENSLDLDGGDGMDLVCSSDGGRASFGQPNILKTALSEYEYHNLPSVMKNTHAEP